MPASDCIAIEDSRNGLAAASVLNRGKTLGTALHGEVTQDELQNLMAGGEELAECPCAPFLILVHDQLRAEAT
jgi:hypothetical protein